MGEAETDDADDDWLHLSFQSSAADGEARFLAALENDELAVKHENSLKHEQSIADEMDHFDRVSRGANLSGGPVFRSKQYAPDKSAEPFGDMSEVNSDHFAVPSDFRSEISESSTGRGPVAALEGYSADNAFGLARSRLQVDGIKQFWETGFWNDFFDPNKS